MKIFGVSLGRTRLMPFHEFRDTVRLAVRRAVPGAKLENRDDGFLITVEGGPPTLCNVRTLYSNYAKAPSDCDAMIDRWMSSLITETPVHTWSEAQITLRPTLKNAAYLAGAQKQMQKGPRPDSVPSTPFVGELSVIVMRDLPGTAVAVTQTLLDEWGVTFEEAMRHSLNNMNMLGYPAISHALTAGGTSRGRQEEVGLVFETDHLTATWLILERFRDYVGQRLQGDFVVAVPVRNRLVAVRADEPGLISQIQQANRGFTGQIHALTTQCFHVSAATTGGVVTVYQPGAANKDKESLDPHSVFARGGAAIAGQASSAASPPAPASPPPVRPAPTDLSNWGSLSESTDDGTPPKSNLEPG